MSGNTERPEVSIIALNLNGRHHLDRCFTSLRDMEYDLGKVERILVDNGSIDDSVRFMSSRFPEVRVIANQQNLGFSVACNLGARAAQGDIIVFLNNDMRVDPQWLRPLVDTIRSGEAQCASSLVLSWDGKCVNFGGAGANFHGIGFQEGLNDTDLDKYRTRKEILFGCGGSMAISKDVFLEAGGFDEDFFAYFEDVDLGWRLWVLGHKVLFVPESVAYHHHHGTSRLMDVHKIRVLYLRNPLYTLFKNYDRKNLLKIFPAALLLSLKRTQYLMGLTDGEFRIDGRETFVKGFLGEKIVKARSTLSQTKVTKAGLADLIAYCDFTDNFKRMCEKREKIQAARKRDDAEILPLFKNPFWAVEEPPEYEEALRLFADFFGFSGIFGVK
ncbi:MAG: glycosyltransferase family 2 protein [Planctomycetota bacterium]